MSPKRVLVIDDNRMLGTMAERVLQKAGYEATVVRDGRDGIRQAQSFAPDLIILDIVMPGMDGYEVAWALKRNPTTANIPVIFLSGCGNTDETEGGSARGLREINQAFEIGASDFLHKPVAAIELLKSVERILSFHDFMTPSEKAEKHGNDTGR